MLLFFIRYIHKEEVTNKVGFGERFTFGVEAFKDDIWIFVFAEYDDDDNELENQDVVDTLEIKRLAYCIVTLEHTGEKAIGFEKVGFAGNVSIEDLLEDCPVSLGRQ